MDRESEIQESQYTVPYHYYPIWTEDKFSMTRYWSWGLQYIGGLKLVIDQLSKLTFSSLVDIGCGDGRFLKEVKRFWPSTEAIGIDYSSRAIAFAKAFNPEAEFRVENIIQDTVHGSFDVATCIEVMEHIRPEQTHAFVGGIAKLLKPRGWLILTVPHLNKPLNEKHYQHFDRSSLKETLGHHFDVLETIPFDRRTKTLSLLLGIVGGKRGRVIVNVPSLNNALYNYYMRHCLYAKDERVAGRIAVLCRKE